MLQRLKARCSSWSVPGAVLLWALVYASSCGVNPLCDRLANSSDRFFAGTAEIRLCQSTEPMGPRISPWSLNRFNNNNCSNGFNKCSTAETKSITSYIECLEAAPVCSMGNENAAAKAIDDCVKALEKNKISPECVVALE